VRQHAASTANQSVTGGICSETCEERKFTRSDYTTALKVAKANGEKVDPLEIDDEGLTEVVDKFALVLTNKDYQMALHMSTEAFYGMDADTRLKAMRNKITSERLNKLGVDRLRCAYVAVRAWVEKKNRLGECVDGVSEYLLLEYLAGVKEEGQKSRAGGCDALEKSVFAREDGPLVRRVSQVWDTRPVQVV
jgi:hypothetical protein